MLAMFTTPKDQHYSPCYLAACGTCAGKRVDTFSAKLTQYRDDVTRRRRRQDGESCERRGLSRGCAR